MTGKIEVLMQRRSLGVLLLFGLFAVTGCMSSLKRTQTVQYCNGECKQKNGESDSAALLNITSDFLKSTQGLEAKVCESSPRKRECRKKGIRFFWQGGPIPGPAHLKTLTVSDVEYAEADHKLKFKLDYGKKDFVWLPFLCSKGDAAIKVDEETSLTMKNTGAYCNWAGVGLFVLNMYISIDYIDVNKKVLGGHYKLTGGGPMNGGGGTGYLLLQFDSQDTQKTAGGEEQNEDPS